MENSVENQDLNQLNDVDLFAVRNAALTSGHDTRPKNTKKNYKGKQQMWKVSQMAPLTLNGCIPICLLMICRIGVPL